MKKRVYKTRGELAKEIGLSRKTLYTKLKNKNIELEKGDISPLDQEMIIKALKVK